MARIWTNSIRGELSTAVASTGTTLDAAIFAELPVVTAPDRLKLTLDPGRKEGFLPEIVEVTDHAAGSTTVTVLRAQETSKNGGAARDWPAGTAVVHPVSASDLELLVYGADPRDYGAVANDDTVDNTAALQRTIDGNNVVRITERFRFVGTLTLHADLAFSFGPEGVLDASDMPINTPWADVKGTVSNATALSADANKADIAVSVAAGAESAFAPGDAVQIRSERQPDTAQPRDGEIHFVDTVSSGQIQLEGGLWDAYTTANTATIEKVNAARNITIDGQGGKIIGAGADSAKGLFLEYCQDVRIRGVTFEHFADNTIQMISCYVVDIEDVFCYWANQAGRGYGIMVLNATQWVTISGSTFIDNRHGVSGGGFSARYGRPRHIVVDGNNFYGGRDSGVDSHSPGQFWEITDNVIECGGFETDNSIDGVAWQGGDVIIANNTIINPKRHGIMVQTLRANDVIRSLVIKGNEILNARQVGILVDIASANMTLNGLAVANNVVDGAVGVSIYIRANATGAAMKNIGVNGNVITNAGSVGLWVRAETGTVHWGTVGNNRVELASANEAIYLYTPTAGNLSRIAINGNAANGGTYGIRAVNQANCFADGNIALGSSGGILGLASAELGSNMTA